MERLGYQEAVSFVMELPLHTKKNAFEETKAFYEWLGEPGSKSNIIHVAGTNGKGSVCAYLNSILTGAGYAAGMFTSPHLTDIRERFVLNGAQIGEETFAHYTALVRQRTEEYEGGRFHPTFFETLFFIFMLWMQEKQPAFILLETGMGGRTDVTNVISHPFAAVITSIGLDHCEYLGNTLEKIAEEKAGILKAGVPAVCWDTDEVTTEIFVKRARELSVPFTIVSKKEVAFSKLRKNNIDFFLPSAYDKDIEAVLSTGALYQIPNAALAVRVAELIGQRFSLNRETVSKGLAAMRWEARMEEILPGVILDGAHNPDGIRAFCESTAQDGCCGKRYLLFGASADKSTADMAGLVWNSGLFDSAAFTCIANRRSMTRAELARLAAKVEGDVGRILFFEDSGEAFRYLTQEKKEQDRIYIAGSLYLAGEIKCCIRTDMEVSHD